MISSLEVVDNGKTDTNRKTSLESIVGGDIILSLYSGDDNSAIEISFPRINENGLNEGSFYTKNAFEANENLSYFSVEGNKLPMTPYIPKYKYTLFCEEGVDGNNGKTYSTLHNRLLSYYGDAYYVFDSEANLYNVYVEGSIVASFSRKVDADNYLKTISMAQYEIYVAIEAKLNNGSVRYFYSNGNDENGYLKLYEGTRGRQITALTPTTYFFQPGQYVVSIYQAQIDGATGDFYKFYKFGFEILSSTPDFEIKDTNEFDLVETKVENNYYTNSPKLKVEWEVPTNIYRRSYRQYCNTLNNSLFH